MKASDIPRLAARVRLAGERLDQAGPLLWERSLGWKHGPGAANLEPFSRGIRHDDDGETVPNDPTGEAGIDGVGALQGMHAELRVRLHRLEQDVEFLNHALAPFVNEPAGDRTAADVSVEGWCRSCFRDDGYLEPVHTDRSGNRIYRDYCRFCGEWVAESKRTRRNPAEPPLVLVQAKHQNVRLTEQMVNRALRKGA